jgi:hypothetical protein
MDDIKHECGKSNNIKTKRGRPKKMQIIQNSDIKKISREQDKDIILSLPGISLASNNIKTDTDTDIDIEVPKLEEKKVKKNKLNKYLMNMSENIYTKLNIEFINNKTGNIIDLSENKSVCWWCTYSFETNPCFIPTSFYNNKYTIIGYFCSFNCASAYNINIADYKVEERNSLLKKICNLINGSNTIIKPAPQREILEKFGGNISIALYRTEIFNNNKEYKINLPLFCQLIPYIEETDKIEEVNSKKVNIYKY